MARISLRSYHREIEGLVDSGRIDEAIGHCRYILKFFPKCIDTYRLLGKAFLESQRYGDAADIFQRVLSSAPEDFVAHAGMSIIRQDEGQLDEALWHMERAFEMQPANSAIQEELRYLYGKRDGFEPPRIRLTRGALARMYAKGDLHAQAIGELRSALVDDPQRVDLQVLLARVYLSAGQRAEAAEAASNVLRKLPNCLEANRIMAEALSSTGHSDEAAAHLQRVQSMDPYSAHLSPTIFSSAKVPDMAVALEKLEWKPDTTNGQPSQPEWAASLGVEVKGMTAEQENLPKWLSSIEQAPRSASSSVSSTGAVAPAVASTDEGSIEPVPEDTLPDWMRSSGWAAAGKAAETDQSGQPDAISSGDEMANSGLDAGDIPEWLQKMAPAGALESAGEGNRPEEGLSWLGEVPTSEPAAEGESGLPAWLGAGAAAAAITGKEGQTEGGLSEPQPAEQELPPAIMAASPDAPATEVPDWLKDLQPGATPTSSEVVPTGPTAENEVPNWLKELQPETNPIQPVATSEEAMAAPLIASDEQAPEGLNDLQPEVAEPVTPEFEQPVPSVPADQLETVSTEAAPTSGVEMKDSDEAFAWLESLAVKQGADEALLLKPEDRLEAPPDWIKESQKSEEITPPEPSSPPPAASASLPDWLQENAPTDTAEAGPSPAEAGATPPGEPSTLPAWLADSTQEQPPAIPAGTGAVEPSGVPDWLLETAPVESPAASIEEEPHLPPIEPGTLPDWLLETAPEAAPTANETPASPVEPAILPDWLLESAPQADLNVPELEQAPLSEEDTKPVRVSMPASEPSAPESPAAEPGSGWIAELLPESPPVAQEDSQATITPPVQAEAETDAGFAWLESLAAKQGAEEALLLKPEDRLEAPPTWVQEAIQAGETGTQPNGESAGEPEAAEAAPSQAAAPVSEGLQASLPAEAPPELPSWLKEIEAAPAEAQPVETESWTPPPLETIQPLAPTNLNQASLAEMERLPGVGFILAQAIVEHRERFGPFKSLDDLQQVSGVTPSTYTDIRGHFQVISPAPVTTPAPPAIEAPPAVAAPRPAEASLPAIEQARETLGQGNIQGAVDQYTALIKSRQALPEVIRDLTEATYRYPVEAPIWQTLGDAYMRDDQLQEALDAYTKAEELLR